MKTAKKVKEITGWKGNAALYQLSEALSGHEYVIVSGLVSAFDHGGPETLVFPATAEGKVINYGELAGGRGYNNHAIALEDAGYTIEE